ncbi:coenzyme F420-0:L-glutamate ligase [Knoellia sp. S7-12]|uniref:coenzyme F420-0:L-glutamate ligase n=1 Tax=Knoellia sp. S7-12 TaxID=3126698 RepID=UPI003367333F
MTRSLTIIPVLGMPEVQRGDDVAELVLAALGDSGIEPGDAVVVSSKIVSKALGLTAVGSDKTELVLSESVRVVAERSVGDRVTRVVESVAGPVMAAAGIDASNTGPSDQLLLLPRDPDTCARTVRSGLLELSGMPSGAPLAVILSDTAGRPWRAGLTDFALGSAGLRVLLDHRGEVDADGRLMSVTARAVADEIAAAADLVKGKTDGVAVAVVRGLPESWFVATDVAAASADSAASTAASADATGEFASGAGQLVRTGAGDWFALGHVEALRQALGVAPGSPDSEGVGIRSVGAETFADRVARVVSLTLFADEDASVDLELDVVHGDPEAVATVTLGAADDFALGRLAQRFEIAAASEDLHPTLTGEPTAEHSVTATLSPGP